MKTVNQQRDELFVMALEVISHEADKMPSFTAQSFVSRADANYRCGNHERAIEYLNIARSYVLPERVTI